MAREGREAAKAAQAAHREAAAASPFNIVIDCAFESLMARRPLMRC